MNRLEQYAEIISLVEHLGKAGSWCGETHIQKSVYFIEQLFPGLLSYEFTLYKFGPFSFDLRDDIGIMVAEGYLELIPVLGFGSQISAGKLAKKIKQLFIEMLSNNESKIQFVAKNLANKNISQLEALATALYVTREIQAKAGRKERVNELRSLKRHIDLDTAKKVVKDVDNILEEAKHLS